MSFCCFSQKTLPLLENQIKETHQRITEELQKYGKDIPEEESEKMFSLIEVSTASGAKLGSRTSLSTGIMGVTLICLHFPKADPNSFCPLSTKTGPELESGQGVVDHPMRATGSSSSALPHWGPPQAVRGVWGSVQPRLLLSCPPTWPERQHRGTHPCTQLPNYLARFRMSLLILFSFLAEN